MPCIRRVAYKVNNKEDVLLCSKNNNSNSVVPMFFCSNVTGEGIDLVKTFLNLLGKRKENSNKGSKDVLFNTDTVFFVTGVGVVLGGHLTMGTIKNGDKLFLGPNKVGKYDEFIVKSIHCKKTLVESVSASCYVCVSLRKITRSMVRKGQVLLGNRAQIVSCREFNALVSVLKTHTTSIKVGYEPVLHLSTIRQTAVIVDIQNKISSKKNSEYNDNILRTGDKAMVRFKFKYRPEFISIGSRILLAEGKIKILGQIKELL
jgi:GTPase